MNTALFLLALLTLSTSWNLLNAQTLTIDPVIVTEADGMASACVTYSTAPATEVVINLSSRDNSAKIDDGDYVAFSTDLTFSQSLPLQQCVDITINLDSSLEGFEDFQVIAANGLTAMADVIIENSDTITVGFDQAEYMFNEDVGGMMCIVVEQGLIQRVEPITITLNFTDGTATEADDDYNPSVINSIDIELTETTPAMGVCIAVPITTDTALEGDESFMVAINSNADIVLSSTMSQATVVITNDDAECIDPPDLPNGSFSLSIGNEATTSSLLGDTATYSCSLGYDLVGDDTLTCSFGNVWSPTGPGTCQLRECEMLDNPANGMVTTDPDNAVFAVATYTCNEGYVLNGDVMRTCELDEMWTGSEPTCEPRDCGTLNGPVDGEVSFAETTFMSTANYSCNAGFAVEGQGTRTCQADGTWDGAEPTCRQLAVCPMLSVDNGQVDAPSYEEGNAATYSCNNGFVLEGEEMRMCQSDGTWSGEAPTCRQLSQCPDLEDIENGNVLQSGNTEGSTATYACDSGFNRVGDVQRTCQDNGQGTATGEWSGNAPTCIVTPVITGGLTQEETIGVGVGVSVAALIIIVLVVVAIVVIIMYTQRRKADKYVLNYSTVYGNQRKTELTSRPLDPSGDSPSPNERSVDVDESSQPPQEMDLGEPVDSAA